MLYQAARDMAYNTISDNETDQYFITTTQMDAFANQALQEIIEATEYKDGDTEWTIGSGTTTIDMSGVMSRLTRVEVDYQPLRPITVGELRRYGTDWRSHTGLPRYYYRDEEYSGTPDQYISVYPEPNATYNLRVSYVRFPAAVSLTADMDIPEWCAETVVWAMLSNVYLADTEIMSIEASEFYGYLFDSMMNRIRARSFSRLPKDWSYQTEPSEGSRLSMWNNVPEVIPAP